MKIVSVILSLCCFTAISATVSNDLWMHYSINVGTHYYASQAFLEYSFFLYKKKVLHAFQQEKNEGNRRLILSTNAPTQAVTVSSTTSLAPTKAVQVNSTLTFAPTSSPSPHIVVVDTNSIGDSPSPVPSATSTTRKPAVPRAPATAERPNVPSAVASTTSTTGKPLDSSSAPGTTRVPSASTTTKKPVLLGTTPTASKKTIVPSGPTNARSPMVTTGTPMPNYGNTKTPSPSLRNPDNSAGAQIEQIITPLLCLIPLAWFLLY